jgi:hypothetical protein
MPRSEAIAHRFTSLRASRTRIARPRELNSIAQPRITR